MKTYLLKPTTAPATVALTPAPDKSAIAKIVPPRQPMPTAVIDPAKPTLKLGLDVHLEFIMAVVQKDHGNPQAPRKFTRLQLVAQVKQWAAEGVQVFCVEESCGFGFVLHRELVAAGTQSFLITPSANAVRWQVWTALLTYLLLRYVAFLSQWGHSFSRLFTVLRTSLWKKWSLLGLLRLYGSAEGHFRYWARPDQAFLPGMS
jgi:hypothetical protein